MFWILIVTYKCILVYINTCQQNSEQRTKTERQQVSNMVYWPTPQGGATTTAALPTPRTTTTTTTTLVCDLGSSTIKVGFAGQRTPELILPCVIGTPRTSSRENKSTTSSGAETGGDGVVLGPEALRRGTNYPPKIGYTYPMTTGHVQDWTAVELLLKHALRTCLRRHHLQHDDNDNADDYSSYNVLLTWPYNMTTKDLQQLVELFLVTFGVRGLTLHKQAALVLYAQGLDSGVVVELGETTTNLIPVYQGHALSHLDRTLPLGGRTLSTYLLQLLRRKGYPFLNERDARHVEFGRHLKERVCYAAYDPTIDDKLATDTTVLLESFPVPTEMLGTTTLPSAGTTITVGRERFSAVEALFAPSQTLLVNCGDNASGGLADMIFDLIQDADMDCRSDLYQHIILSGGTALLPGLQERVQKDITHRYTNEVLRTGRNCTYTGGGGGVFSCDSSSSSSSLSPTSSFDSSSTSSSSSSLGWKPQVHTPKSRPHLVYEGAALFADYIAEDHRYWISREEYVREGMQCIFDKCTVQK